MYFLEERVCDSQSFCDLKKVKNLIYILQDANTESVHRLI